jgi:hypothetical protein
MNPSRACLKYRSNAAGASPGFYHCLPGCKNCVLVCHVHSFGCYRGFSAGRNAFSWSFLTQKTLKRQVTEKTGI